MLLARYVVSCRGSLLCLGRVGSQCHNSAFAVGGCDQPARLAARAGGQGALYPSHSSAPFQYIFHGAHLLSPSLPRTLTRELSYSKAQNARSAINLHYSAVSYGGRRHDDLKNAA